SLVRGDRTLRASIARYLAHAVGLDATGMRGAIVVARALDARDSLVVVVDGVRGGRIAGKPSGGYRDVVWRPVRGTTLFAALNHGALLVGTPRQLRWIIDHLTSRRTVPRGGGEVQRALRSPTLRRAALALALRVRDVDDMRARLLRGLYGGELAMLAVELGGVVRFRLQGDTSKLGALAKLARPLLSIGMRRLARARDHAVKAESMTRALALIVAHRIAQAWLPELQPRMARDGALVSHVSFGPVARLAAPQWLPTLAALVAVAGPAAAAATRALQAPPRVLELARAALTIYHHRERRRGAAFRFPASARALRLVPPAGATLHVTRRGRGRSAFVRVELRRSLGADDKPRVEALEATVGADGALNYRYIPPMSR
ncbi:MAG: hypothetical protein KC503_42530, partial [Myxococcales bacterium]|nr:hypothetical protein [Myxococcales bacterium]